MANEVGRHEVAIKCIGLALQLNPTFPEGWYNLGNAYRDCSQYSASIQAYLSAISVRSDYAQAMTNLGIVLALVGRKKEAIGYFEEAVRLRPDLAAAQTGLGACLQESGKPFEAELCYYRALASDPFSADTYNNLGNALKDQARVDDAIVAYRRALELSPDLIGAYNNLLYTLWFSTKHDAATILDEHRRWNEQLGQKHAMAKCHTTSEPTTGRRIRIGYVSAHFRQHVLAHYLVPLLSHHNRQQFEIFCYSDVRSPDGITERLKEYADTWRDITYVADERLAEVISGDHIDVLVDLAMHMEGSRLRAFATKPAPIQVCWLAYPGTTGLSAMDYRLTDPYLDPPGDFDEYYSEASLRLPDTFWCYDPLAEEPDVNALPAMLRGHLTFGCFSNFCKVNETTIELWAGVLNAIADARFTLMAPSGPCRGWVLEAFDRFGVKKERIEFVARCARHEYLMLYHGVDIMLDTIPYNGHTTTLDAAWMGVPVVTIKGRTVVGRAGVSQLTNLCLPNLIAETPSQFVQCAVALAGDRNRLMHIRATLRQQMQVSALMDASRFATSIERTYTRMLVRAHQ